MSTGTSGTTGTTATAASGRMAQLTTVVFEARVLALINARRHKVGCKALRVNTALTNAARRHTSLMLTAGNLSHQLPRELGLSARIAKAGYGKWRGLAENIAWGSNTPRATYRMWMNSAGHRANIQRCLYRDAGVGVSYKNGRPWITLDLGRHR